MKEKIPTYNEIMEEAMKDLEYAFYHTFGVEDSYGDNATPYMELRENVTIKELWKYMQDTTETTKMECKEKFKKFAIDYFKKLCWKEEEIKLFIDRI